MPIITHNCTNHAAISQTLSNMTQESCTPGNTLKVSGDQTEINVSFTLPEKAVLLRIERDDVDVTERFVQTNQLYSYNNAAANASDAGVYTMFHESQGKKVNCQSLVIIADRVKISKVGMFDSIVVYLSYGTIEWGNILELFPDLLEAADVLTYELHDEQQVYKPITSEAVELQDGKIKFKGLTNCLKTDGVVIHSTDESLVRDRVTFPWTNSCQSRFTRCNGIVECDDMSDELGCSVQGVYSRMAVSKYPLFLTTPYDNLFTICLYSFGPGFLAIVKEIAEIKEGHYCVRNENLVFTVYKYDEQRFKNIISEDGSLSQAGDPLTISSESLMKNIILYNKLLSAAEMLNYISKCGEQGYPTAEKSFIDHHAIMTMNTALSSAILSATLPAALPEGWLPLSESYTVLSSMCEEIVRPAIAVNMVSSYICNSGTIIPYHCSSIESERCDDSDETECDYAASNIVAMAATGKKCPEKAWIVNAWNNWLGVVAINATNIGCDGSTCVNEAFLEMLKAGETDYWANEISMEYVNWQLPPTPEDFKRDVVLNRNESWTVKDEFTENGRQLCNLAKGSADLENRGITFSTDKYSRLAVNKTSRGPLDKCTMCWAASGTGDLLHYAGSSSITGRDIYIRTDQSGVTIYLTVFIAGFPEYFKIDKTDSNKYICLRWEKITGRIDLAVDGRWIVGKNTYANSRKIKLSRSGILMVGTDMNVETRIKGAGSWSGTLHNLVIWNDFFTPLMLKETSKSGICERRAKTKAWLTFEEVIAGCTDSDVYQVIESCSDLPVKRSVEKLGTMPESPVKRSVEKLGTMPESLVKRSVEKLGTMPESPVNQSVEERGTVPESPVKRNVDLEEHSVSVNFDAYLNDPSDISSWMDTSEEAVSVLFPTGSTYAVKRRSDQLGSIKLEALSELCLSGLSSGISHDVTVTVHNSGLTLLQIGQHTKTVDKGSPAEVQVTDVFAIGRQICITNLLSPSDYYPLDGFIEKVSYVAKTDDPILCPGEEEVIPDKGNITWPATSTSSQVSEICPYGKAPERYSEVGLALRECTNNGWATTVSSDCATKFTISTTEANEYFEETELSDSNVEEYTETIIQVLQDDTETVTNAQLETAAEALHKLSNSENVVISETTLESVVEVANTINIYTDAETIKKKEEDATKVVESVANLAAKVDLAEDSQFSAKTETVSVVAVNPSTFGEGSEDIVADFRDNSKGTDIDVNRADLTGTKSSTITISKDKIKDGKNVWFTSYNKDSNLFSSNTDLKLDGQIVGAGIGEETQDFKGQEGVKMTFYTGQNTHALNALCQFWDMSNSQLPGWSSRGMTLVEKTEEYIVCESSHLTNFAILINPSNTIFTGTELEVLEWITKLGCSLSIVGLTATVVGLAAFKKIRSVLTNRVHIGLSTSLLFAYMSLLIGADRTSDKAVCYFFSILIHFCFLSAFCWMLCEAVNLYLRLVVVFDSHSHMFLKFCVFSFVFPTVVVLITVIFEFAGGSGAYLMYEQASGRIIYCWLDYKVRMVAFMFPLIIIYIVNFVVFILVMRVLFASKKSVQAIEATNKTKWLARLRSAVAVSSLIGLTWILGFVALGEASFAINVAFALVNSFQGCLICYQYCIAKTDVVKTWKTSFQTSISRYSGIEKGGLSTSSTAPQAKPFRSNAPTKSTSLGMSRLTPKSNPVSSNVYSNEASTTDHDLITEDPGEDGHIYEELDSLKNKYVSSTSEEENQTLNLSLPKNLHGAVKEKVITYEEISAKINKRSNVQLNFLSEDKHESSDPNTSFQIKSDGKLSEGSPFEL